MNKIHNELVAFITKILYGASFHKEELSKVSITDETLTEISKLKDELVILDNEKSRLEALLKTKTEEYNLKRDETELHVSNIRQGIKRVIPHSYWKEFGIDDQK